MTHRLVVAARATVALVGTLPLATLAGIALALFAPAPEDVRIALGIVMTIPLWVVAMCLAYLDDRAWRAALALGAATAVLAGSVAAFAQDAAPTEEVVADDEAPPADDRAPVEDDAAPVEDDAAPVEDDAAPVEDDAAPVEDDAAPVEDDAAPVEDDEAWGDDLLTDDVVVSATSEADELAQSADSVRIVAIDEVRAQSADMGEVLARSEGVSVRRSGGLGSTARLCIHGICDSGIRYFLDGVPLELAGFGLGVSNVPVNMVERVEIYRGAVPVRLGTDALGGVINLVRPSRYYGLHAGGYVQTGSWGTYRLFTEAGTRHDESGLYASASAFYDRADNDYPIDVEVADSRGRLSDARVRRFHDRYEAYGIAVEAGLAGVSFADRLSIRGFLSEYDRDLQNNVVMTVPYGEAVYGEVSWGGLLRYQHEIVPGLSIDTFVGYTRRDISFTDASPWVYDWYGNRVRARRTVGEIGTRPTDQSVWEDAVPARLNLSWQIAPEHRVHLNVTPTYTTRSGDERIESNPGGRDPLTARRDLFTMVSGLEYHLSLLERVLENQIFVKDYVYIASSEEVLPGFTFVERRRESHDIGIGDGLRWRILPELFVRGTYELATRLPAPYEVFGDGVLVGPNLDLSPERSHNGTLEVALDVRDTPIGAIEAEAAGFVRWRQNMIVLLGNDRVLTYQNVYEALAIGAEASLAWTSPGDWVRLAGNATYLEDRNSSEEGTFGDFAGDRIPNRPFFFANFSADLRAHDLFGNDELTLSWRGRYVHEFFRGWESQGRREYKQTVPSQLAQDLALTYTVLGPPRVSATIEMTNITDERLFDFFGAQRPGRAGFVKLSIDY
ncbi:TonB-dependent receptor domain-containing protein [Sandaracinus amylolyticus]|uniref:LSU ribosomal protein L25p n=1 Tax=Sandaracinus amylolyticus TaxID=927083 RepID=A0A0F6SGG0_9BACT|nr:TonB-dependent receptor [Sandaracinus amylolyticus]AKF08629.1 LSU ribosomal protein L25p [Sandaracinus amylolyticus]